MSLFLVLAFLFFIGSVFGWGLECFYRRFFSGNNPSRKWINPGFCTGPYLPLYGSGLCCLYLLASVEAWGLIPIPVVNKIVLLLFMGLCMTGLEYIAGFWSLKYNKVRLWDYSEEWGNIQGIICPKFTAFWTILAGIYYFAVHPYILSALNWLSENLAFSFVIGMFFGVFCVDIAHSAKLVVKLKALAEERQVVLRYEELKMQIRAHIEAEKEKYSFFRPFRTKLPLDDQIREFLDKIDDFPPISYIIERLQDDDNDK